MKTNLTNFSLTALGKVQRSTNRAGIKSVLIKKVVSATIALALMAAVPISSWASPKLELVSQVSLANSGAVTVQDNYAYIGDSATLKIFDVSNPAKPTVVGTSAPMPDSYIMEVIIKGNYAYVANARGGLRILDISNPQHPFEVGVYNTNQPNDGNDWTLWGVDVRDNYAYVADMGSGLRIVDVSNPANPVEVSFIGSHGLTHAVKLNGNFAYMVDWSGGLRIVDITNPESPEEVGFLATRGLTYGVAFNNDGNLAYVADYDGLRIVDISNPQSPKEISFFDTPGIAINVIASGNYVYVNSYSELKVLDVSNPQSPQQVDSYNAPVNSSGYGLGRHKLNNSLLYVPNGDRGLLILSNGDCGGVTSGNCLGNTVTLTLTTANGTVTCNNTTCQSSYPVGDTVNLVATPADGSSFKEWLGDCSGMPSTTNVIMDAAKNCTAVFVKDIVALTITTVGNGTVTCNGGTCQSSYPTGETVNLVAIPASGFTFNGWTVDCSGTNATTTVTMNAVKNCTATFELGTMGLTLATVGSGTVTCNGGACQSSYPAGHTVNLLAKPANDFSFNGWTGNCGGTNTTTTVTMDADKNCTATFEKNIVTLTLTPSPILTNSQMGTTTLNINPTGNCGPISWRAEEPKTGGYITNLLVSPQSGTGNATITISYRKSSVLSPKKGNAKVRITAYCGNSTATVTKTAIIR